MEHPDILEKIIVFSKDIDLYALMQTCKTIRNIVGKSDAWKYAFRASNLPKYMNIEEIFKLFMSISLNKQNFAIRDYYGDWYYLHVMKKWLAGYCQTSWNLYSILCLFLNAETNETLKKMSTICGFISEPVVSKYYDDWSLMMPTLAEKLNFDIKPYFSDRPFYDSGMKLSSEHSKDMRDKILQFIYVDTYSYNYGDNIVVVTITNTKIKRGPGYPGFVWYPIKPICLSIDPKHFYYRFKFDYFSDRFGFCSYSKNGDDGHILWEDGLLEIILEIADKLEVNGAMLFEIMKIVAGKTSPRCEKKIDEFINSYTLRKFD